MPQATLRGYASSGAFGRPQPIPNKRTSSASRTIAPRTYASRRAKVVLGDTFARRDDAMRRPGLDELRRGPALGTRRCTPVDAWDGNANSNRGSHAVRLPDRAGVEPATSHPPPNETAPSLARRGGCATSGWLRAAEQSFSPSAALDR